MIDYIRVPAYPCIQIWFWLVQVRNDILQLYLPPEEIKP